MAPPPADAFTVALIYVKTLEMKAIGAMLDERYGPILEAEGDRSDYTLGRIGDHNVAIVGPPRGSQGVVAAAQFAATLRLTFPNVTVGLLIGIGGGIPRYPAHDVRLGDVVVGAPETGSAVVQYDLGKRTADDFELTGSIAQPPALLLQVVSKVEAALCWQDKDHDVLKSHLDRFSKFPKLRNEYKRPSVPDRLFHSTYLHEPGTICSEHDEQFEHIRPPRESDHVVVHYSAILSGNTLMRSSEERDRLSLKHCDALCFEMEAAGLMDVFPCLVIRGISDYSDSHKNDVWQNYAAAAAAAYARELLLNMSKQTTSATETSKMAKTGVAGPEDWKKGRPLIVFSGTGTNSGVQVGHNAGSMTNTFGMR